MAGNYGPDDKMRTAIAAYTPNVPWARFDEPAIVDFDGNGTSAATPQIAAAAALWIEKHRGQYERYSEGWKRVEDNMTEPHERGAVSSSLRPSRRT
jgi:hypothetical protein